MSIHHVLDTLERKLLWKNPERALQIYRKAPRFFVEAIRLMNLRRSVRLASEKSIFYSKQFEKYPVDFQSLRSPRDLVPLFTSEKDLAGTAASRFLCGRPDTAFETTGTSSRIPKRIFFSNRELEDAGRVGAVGLWNLGVRPDDKVVSAFDYSFWVSGPALKSALGILGCFHVEAGRMDPCDFYERVKSYQCNVIVSDPGWLVGLSEIAEAEGPWPVKLLMAGGENISEASRRYVESVWQCPLIMTYGQTEAFGMIGAECGRRDGYHVNDMDLWVEIPSPDAEGYGELVYTTLRRSVMPILRYRSGDVTRIMPEPCPCGMPSVRLAKLRGRSDEMVVTGAGNLAPWMVQDAIDGSGLGIREWQVRLRQEARKDRIQFCAESDGGLNGTDARDRLLDGMKHRFPGVHQGILSGLVKFEVQLMPPGELRTGRKVKRIVDERNFDRENERSPVLGVR